MVTDPTDLGKHIYLRNALLNTAEQDLLYWEAGNHMKQMHKFLHCKGLSQCEGIYQLEERGGIG